MELRASPPLIDLSLLLPGAGPATGVERLELATTVPQGQRGELATRSIILPRWRHGCYYAAAQRYDTHGQPHGLFPDGSNRCQPLCIVDFRSLVTGGNFLLIELSDGRHLALLPLSGVASCAWFAAGEDGALHIVAGTFGTAPVSGEISLLSWACATDPYAACAQVWSTAIKHLGQPTQLRAQKTYPEPFRYLGWCSWEHFRFDISMDKLLAAFDEIETSGLPIRFLLVDDGHIDVDTPEAPEEQQRLRRFSPRADRFPQGWGPLLARRQADGVAWFGLWLNFNGYWSGIAANHDLGPLAPHLAPIANHGLQPGDAAEDSVAFYDAFIGSTRRAGFDFVKVDNQANNLALLTGRPNGVACATHNARALEAACDRELDALLNCMAHGPVCPFHTRHSVVTRCSEDYLNGDLPRARRHLHNSYANMVWLGQTAWGDHDMFHSNDTASARLMAVSKAISGGPVYLSDPPAHFVAEHITPLCFDDGRLLRPLAPATPVRRSLYANPFADPTPYVVAAPLPGGAAAVVAYNLTEPVVPVSGSLSAADYAEADALLPGEAPAWTVPSEGLVLYDWADQTATELTAPHAFDLPGFDHFFALLCPIRTGWAVIGLVEKFLSPAGVEIIAIDANELVLRCADLGPVAVYSQRGNVTCREHPVTSRGSGLFVVETRSGSSDHTLLHFRH